MRRAEQARGNNARARLGEQTLSGEAGDWDRDHGRGWTGSRRDTRSGKPAACVQTLATRLSDAAVVSCAGR